MADNNSLEFNRDGTTNIPKGLLGDALDEALEEYAERNKGKPFIPVQYVQVYERREDEIRDEDDHQRYAKRDDSTSDCEIP